MNPTEVPILYRDLEPYKRYQFVLDAANVVKTLTAEVKNRNATEHWPLMLNDPDGEMLFVTEEECRNIRLVCPECDSPFFYVRKDKNPICYDCAYEAHIVTK